MELIIGMGMIMIMMIIMGPFVYFGSGGVGVSSSAGAACTRMEGGLGPVMTMSNPVSSAPTVLAKY